MRKLIVSLCFILVATTEAKATDCSATIPQGTSESCNVITQFGITWTLSQNRIVGQFVNGDYWMVDPGSGVAITSISPGYTATPRVMNGSMVNPVYGQGYDAYITAVGSTYTENLNVGTGITAETPLVLASNDTLISTISNVDPSTAGGSFVKAASVLTCLTSPPVSGSFRPGLCNGQKTIHNTGSLDYAKLSKLAVPYGLTINAETLTTTANSLRMAFIDHSGFESTYMRPSDSGLFSRYYYGFDFTEAALLLHLNFTELEKSALLINYIQLAIDLYSFIEAGPSGALASNGAPFYGWQPDGGNSNNRKWPILFAGIMLDYAPMKNIGQRSGDYLYSNGHGAGNPPADYVHFGEDGQTFYVAQSDVDLTNGGTWAPMTDTAPNYPYTSSMIGMPEWGAKYGILPQTNDAAWTANYRAILSGAGVCFAGDAMAARLTVGGKALWNHNAFFDYVDRYMAISKGDPDPFGYTVPRQTEGLTARPTPYLQGKMFDTYRTMYDRKAVGGSTPTLSNGKPIYTN